MGPEGKWKPVKTNPHRHGLDLIPFKLKLRMPLLEGNMFATKHPGSLLAITPCISVSDLKWNTKYPASMVITCSNPWPAQALFAMDFAAWNGIFLNLVVESDTLTLSAHDCCVLGGGGAGLTLGCVGVAVVFWVAGSLRVAISCVLFGVIAVDESWLDGSR
ncbi:hypothetical protein OIU84_018238, partial [Salix udensis]